MTLRPVPVAATWILKRFLRVPEDDFVIGDLAEQYQNGRSSFWYWRQVVAIVIMGCYRKVVNRPLMRTNIISMNLSNSWTEGSELSRLTRMDGSEVRADRGTSRTEAIPTHFHHGINTASLAGEGLEGLPGLLIAIGFVFMFLSIFLPKHSDGLMIVFLAVEGGAAALYLIAEKHNRADSERVKKALHEINEPRNRD